MTLLEIPLIAVTVEFFTRKELKKQVRDLERRLDALGKLEERMAAHEKQPHAAINATFDHIHAGAHSEKLFRIEAHAPPSVKGDEK